VIRGGDGMATVIGHLGVDESEERYVAFLDATQKAS
jgi:hypothetical protein